MDVLINHVSIMPRPDGGPKLFKPENAVTRLIFDQGFYKLEITDRDNPEFRARVSISETELSEAKAQEK